MDMLEAKLNPYMIYCSCNESIANQIAGKSHASRVTRYHELELITDGWGTMKINDTTYKLKKGDLFYHPPDMKITGTMPYGYILIIFDPYFNHENIARYGEGKKSLGNDINCCESDVIKQALPVPLYISVDKFNAYRFTFKKIFTSFATSGNNLESKIILLQLLYELKVELTKISDNNNFINTKSYYKKIMKCAKNIEGAPEVNYSLEKLANEANLSKNFMCAAFKEIIGITLFSYIHEKRIDKAKVMLIETQLSVEKIAYYCGFENMSYFYRIFKKHTGVSPASYRKYYRL